MRATAVPRPATRPGEARQHHFQRDSSGTTMWSRDPEFARTDELKLQPVGLGNVVHDVC